MSNPAGNQVCDLVSFYLTRFGIFCSTVASILAYKNDDMPWWGLAYIMVLNLNYMFIVQHPGDWKGGK